jgi:oxalate decarboxylase/phosphoglucose isomerase-like protein (cupin superfamily)
VRKRNLNTVSGLSWKSYGPDARFNYPIGYHGALLGHDKFGHLDLLYRWDPGKYCHFHRHLCDVRSTVIAGQLEVVVFESGIEVSSVTRETGSFSYMPPGDVHMERGGPNGATVLFHLFAPEGQLTELLAEDGTALKTLTTEEVLSQLKAQ